MDYLRASPAGRHAQADSTGTEVLTGRFGPPLQLERHGGFGTPQVPQAMNLEVRLCPPPNRDRSAPTA